METERNISQLRKGLLEYCILLILKRREAYASDIIDQLKEAEMIVVEGTLYPLLTRLKNEGLLNYRWEESKTGPPRKYYQITENGTFQLEQLNEAWQKLISSIEKISQTS